MKPASGKRLAVLSALGGLVLLFLLLPNLWQTCVKLVYHLVGID